MFIFGTKNLKITGNGNGSLLSESRLSSPGNVRESCSKAEITSGVTRLAALVLLLLFFFLKASFPHFRGVVLHASSARTEHMG